MKIKWALTIIIGFLLGIAVLSIKPLTYVPFKLKESHITDLNHQELVTLKGHHFNLKRSRYPISTISSIDDMTSDQVILLPWNTVDHRLQFVPINGHSFHESNLGTVQIKTIAPKGDGYNDFLNQKITLTAAGTVVLARGVHKQIQRHNDINHPWKDTAHRFKNSDINILNFKSPLVANFSYPRSSWVLVGKSVYAKAMASAKIDLVSLSGNHMGDAKSAGLLETIQTLHGLNIETVGAGKSNKSAYECKKIAKKNTIFGFLGFNNVPGSIGKPTKTSPGIAWLDEDALSAIRQCNKQVDVLVVMVNWGIEYTHYPRPIEKNWAKKMADAGADLILGDQAHWVQLHDIINDTHVSYGLGNYIFDQHWSEKTTEGIIQTFVFYNQQIMAVETIPIKLFKNGQIKEIEKNNQRYYDVLDAYNGI